MGLNSAYPEPSAFSYQLCAGTTVPPCAETTDGCGVWHSQGHRWHRRVLESSIRQTLLHSFDKRLHTGITCPNQPATFAVNLPRKLFPALRLVLAAAVGLQIWAVVNQPAPRPPPELESMIPAYLPGWTMRELPLGEPEETRNAVASTLQFDRFISRVYSRSTQVVTVYVAYWQPGKVPPRAVGVHTPDTC